MKIYDDVSYIKGIGPKKKYILNKLGIFTVEDFLLDIHPIKFLDKRSISSIASITQENDYFIKAKLFEKRIEKKKGKDALIGTFYDSTGSVEVIWFNGIDYYVEFLKLHMEYYIYGRAYVVKKKIIFIHPEIEECRPDREFIMEPRYSTGEIFQKVFYFSHSTISEVIKNSLKNIDDDFGEFLPSFIKDKYNLPPRSQAFWMFHFPNNPQEHQKALNYFKLEESILFLLKAKLLKKKIKERFKAVKIENAGNLIHEFYHNRLDFQLTNAQKRVLKEIRKELSFEHPMNMLLQGDVGSGKTIVALMTILIMAANNYQSCLMAPTEILAIQHWNTFMRYLFGMPVVVDLLTGSTTPKEREKILEGLKKGTIHVLIGTHALIEEDVEFAKLGLVIIDEQHKFGVIQRKKLLEKGIKGTVPHLLVMTATPIPRTIAMTLYGDMDIAILDEMPPGRKPPITKHFFYSQRENVVNFIRKKILEGEQCYWVFPLIEPSEKLAYENIEIGFERLKTYFNEIPMDMLHGRMPYRQKKEIVDKLRRKEIKILATTPVIEVGIDVPAVNLMVIESGEKFGLSQLHQLRGRVGRSSEQGYCFVITSDNLTPEANQRINTFLKYTDGFKIAEEDLKIRGPGDMLGTEQSGNLKHLKFTNLSEDIEIIKMANSIAEEIANIYYNLPPIQLKLLSERINKTLSQDELIIMT